MADKKDDDDSKVTGVDDIRSAVEDSLKPDDPDKNDDDSSDTDDDDDTSDNDDSDDDDSKDDDSSDDDDSDDSDDDDSDDDSDDDDSDNDDDDSKSGRKFAQFVNKDDDTDEAYITNLEEGYSESSAESLRLKGELDTATARNEAIMKAIAKDSKLAEAFEKALGKDSKKGDDSKDDDSTPPETTDPFLKDAQTKWQKQNQSEAADFIKANPEMATDQDLRKEVTRLVRVFSQDHYKEKGELMTAGEAMRKAYAYLGKEDKSQEDSKAELAERMKRSGKSPKKGSSKKKNRKSDSSSLTKSQIEMGAKFGYSKEKLEKLNSN